jgi:beta-lactamase regulating signal transducer with metallopeptidase domain
MQGIGKPFALASPSHSVVSMATLLTRALPVILLATWFTGFLAVLLFWCFRVRRLHAAAQTAVPLDHGPEFETLRGLERESGIIRPLRLLASTAAIEPGILGIFRPALLLPAGISERLTTNELESVLTHELCHVRYCDNLAAALHMFVEALFWFHPFTWWIGARLVDERERACDEEVLARGSDPQTYAESILKICKFYLESPVILAAGVTGSNLKKRIEAIMRHLPGRNLESTKKVLFATIAALAFAVPIMFGFTNAATNHAQKQSAPLVAPALEDVRPDSTTSKSLNASPVVAQTESASPAEKFVLGDLKLEGNIHDGAAIYERIVKEWANREYGSLKDMTDVADGVRKDFQERGYFKVVVGKPEFQILGTADNKKRVLVTLPVTEGNQYRLGTLSVQNANPNQPLSIRKETLREQFPLHTGDLFSVSRIREGMEKSLGLYHANGFADANVVPETDINETTHVVNLILRVTEGPHTT